jgi:hypothetical protein
MRTLAAFKRAIAGGATVTLIKSEGWRGGEPHRALGIPRKASRATPNSKAILWDDGSSLGFGKASQWTFEGNRAVLAFDGYDGPIVLTYEVG